MSYSDTCHIVAREILTISTTVKLLVLKYTLSHRSGNLAIREFGKRRLVNSTGAQRIVEFNEFNYEPNTML